MDNPGAILADDATDWTPITPPANVQDGTSNTAPAAKSSLPPNEQRKFQNRPPQQHYSRNASTFSLDIPATLGLMATYGTVTTNIGSKTSST